MIPATKANAGTTFSFIAAETEAATVPLPADPTAVEPATAGGETTTFVPLL
jgi:hypothetical protein